MRRIRLALCSVLLLSSVTHAAHANPVVWLPVMPLHPLTQTYVSAFSNGSFYVHNTGVANVFVSPDFGLTWEARNPPPNKSAGRFEMLDPDSGFFIPSNEFSDGSNVYRTGDGARSWSLTTPLPVPEPAWTLETRLGYLLHVNSLNTSRLGGLLAIGSELFRVDSHLPCSGTRYALRGENRPALHTSLDGGETWRRTTFPPIEGPGATWVDRIDFLDRQHGVVLIVDLTKETDPGEPCTGFESTGQRLFVTHDGGISWNETPLPFPYRPRTVTAMTMVSPDRVLLGLNDSSTFVSDDGGASFAEGQALNESAATQIPTEAYWVLGFDFANENVGYASTNGGWTWKTRDGGRTWTPEVSPQRALGLGLSDIATADEEHAITGGPNVVSVRRPS